MPRSEAPSLYTKSVAIVGVYKWHQRHLQRLQELTSTRRSYTQHLLCHVLDWCYRQRLEIHAYQTMHTLYNTESRQKRQQLYLHRKRPREERDPRLWEIPLLPLLKWHKAH